MNLSMTASAADLVPKPVEPHRAATIPERPPLPLAKARDYADKITEWISPYCRQVEPVGEIRRRLPRCQLIELLVLPRIEASANTLFSFLDHYVQNEQFGAARWRHETGRADLRGLPPTHYASSATLFLPKCTLTIHCATPENWFLRLFETTGSAAHLNTLVIRVRSLPGQWHPADYIRVRSQRVLPQSEGHIYDLLNMSLIPPWKRTD